MKKKIPSLSYNAMFKAVFSKNKVALSKLTQAILSYCDINIDIEGKELIIKNNELPISNYKDRQLICDYIIKVNDEMDLNIEINRAYYPGLTERNMTYSFKIFYEHFKSGDDYKEFSKYSLVQVNFNKFPNPNRKTINKYLLLDFDDVNNSLSEKLKIINIDIASCFNLVYNKSELDGILELERWSAIIGCDYLEDISSIIRSDMLSMEEKERFLDDVMETSLDKDVLRTMKFEDSIDYRFDLVREDALEQGMEQGFVKGVITTIKNMLNKNIALDDISDITGKSVEEIKEIKKSLGDEMETSFDKDVLRAMKFEDSIDYRFDLVREDALEQGREENTVEIIKNMLNKNIALDDISDITGKSIDEIKKIKKSVED